MHLEQVTRNSVMAVLLLAGCIMAVAQEKGNWRAVSSSAQSITGDVTLSDTRLSISFVNFPIAHIRDLQPGEISAAFEADGSSGKGSLYRLNVPADRRFIHKNTLCGDEDTQWMATYAEGRTLHIAFFSGQKPPVLTPEAFNNSTDLCGIFTYSR